MVQKMQTVNEEISKQVTLETTGTQDYELHSPSPNANIFLTVVLCLTLKPNGKFCTKFVSLDMCLTNSLKESNMLNASVFIQLSGNLYSFFIYFIYLFIYLFITFAILQ